MKYAAMGIQNFDALGDSLGKLLNCSLNQSIMDADDSIEI
jgi:hypothetical protein